MDDAPQPLAAPIPGAVPSGFGSPPQLGQFPAQVRAPGRPPEDAQKRETADANYAAMKEFEGNLPPDAKEHRLMIYKLDHRTGFKRHHRPVGYLLQSQVKEMNLSDPV